jgi:hypothetical protein
MAETCSDKINKIHRVCYINLININYKISVNAQIYIYMYIHIYEFYFEFLKHLFKCRPKHVACSDKINKIHCV